MNKKRLAIKVSAGVMALAIAFVSFGLDNGYVINISANSMSDLEQQQQQLSAERQEIEKKLKDSEGKTEELDQYLADYDEKMRIQEEEMDVVTQQVKLIEEKIAELDLQIADKQVEIDENIEHFKLRLRAIYVSGNDSIASVLVGSSDFYDVLARMEFVKRVSASDKKLIDELNDMIFEFNSQKEELELEKSKLQTKKSDQENYLSDLQETYNNHSETKEIYEKQAEMYANRTSEIEQQEAEIEQEIQEYIRKQQEELERKREEERKRKEEEERLRKEEEERLRLEEEQRRKKEEERLRLEAEQSGVEYVPVETEPIVTEPEPVVEETPTYSQTGFIWPVPTVRNMTDGYGNRWIVEESRNNMHKGIDINKPGCAGEPIVASAAGTVITAGNTGNGYGYHVVIDHGGKIATLYGHCSKLAVSVGQEVKQGDVIGYIGCTGYAYGNHCHFEVRVNGQHVDPLNYVNINN